MTEYWYEAHLISVIEPQWIKEGEEPKYTQSEYWIERHVYKV